MAIQKKNKKKLIKPICRQSYQKKIEWSLKSMTPEWLIDGIVATPASKQEHIAEFGVLKETEEERYDNCEAHQSIFSCQNETALQ